MIGFERDDCEDEEFNEEEVPDISDCRAETMAQLFNEIYGYEASTRREISKFGDAFDSTDAKYRRRRIKTLLDALLVVGVICGLLVGAYALFR